MKSESLSCTHERLYACTHAHTRTRGWSKGHCIHVNDLPAHILAINPSLAGDRVPRAAAADVEPDTEHGPRGAHGDEAAYPRVRLTVRSYRARLADPDGISVKAAIDGLVEAGVIKDDNAGVVVGLTIEQVKGPRADERTVIVVESVEG